jgi:acyl-CoA synthetase (AMP-forming)/AMP-acid ligase II
VVDALPLTGTGKVDRRACRARFLAHSRMDQKFLP